MHERPFLDDLPTENADGRLEYVCEYGLMANSQDAKCDKEVALQIYNEDCVTGADRYFGDETVDLLVCDPPFGIGEVGFDKHYARNESHVLDGYVEAPADYGDFTSRWIEQAARVLKPDGSMYVISGWNHLSTVLVMAESKGLEQVNHIIWKYNFGVATTRKFVTSHYHILYLKKKGGKPTFNTHCRFGPQHKTKQGKSALYQDMEDVWVIPREYQPGEIKNKNKLPEALLEKIILYSSNGGDVVCDFFLGNFTTAIVAKKLGRTPWGFELNQNSFDHQMIQIQAVEEGCRLREIGEVEVHKPTNQGKPLTEEDKNGIFFDYQSLRVLGKLKKDCIEELMRLHGRGRFGVINVIKDREKDHASDGDE